MIQEPDIFELAFQEAGSYVTLQEIWGIFAHNVGVQICPAVTLCSYFVTHCTNCWVWEVPRVSGKQGVEKEKEGNVSGIHQSNE